MYVDTSALLKRYVDEHDSDLAVAAIANDPVLVTSWLTDVELRRNLTRLVGDATELDRLRQQVAVDVDVFNIVALDQITCRLAARIAEQTLCRSPDAMHLAAAQRAGRATAVLTFDVRQARAAREVGLEVVGV